MRIQCHIETMYFVSVPSVREIELSYGGSSLGATERSRGTKSRPGDGPKLPTKFLHWQS